MQIWCHTVGHLYGEWYKLIKRRDRCRSEEVRAVRNRVGWRPWFLAIQLWCCLGLGCCQGPRLGSFPWCSCGSLHWCPWLLLPLRVQRTPAIRTTTYDQVDVQEICTHRHHIDVRFLFHHPGPCWPLAQTMSYSMALCGSESIFITLVNTEGCADAWRPSRHLRPCWS